MRYKRCPVIPEGLVRVVNALYADFDRRAEQIKAPERVQEEGGLDFFPQDRLRRMQILNQILVKSVYAVCEESIAETMLFDLKNDIGYEKSALSLVMSHKTYYHRKRSVKLEAARRLGLM